MKTNWLSFLALQDLRIVKSRLSVSEEKEQIVPDFKSHERNWRELWEEHVEAEITSTLKNTFPEQHKIISFWNCFKIIAYHAFKNRKILQLGSSIEPIWTKKQFFKFFPPKIFVNVKEFQDSEEEDSDPDDEEGKSPEEIWQDGYASDVHMPVLVFDGYDENDFNEFFEFARQSLCGERPRQKEFPLYKWKNNWNEGLISFFRAKLGGKKKGWCSNFQDVKIRELKRNEKSLSRQDAEDQHDAIHKYIEQARLTHMEYLCLMLMNSGEQIDRIAILTRKSIQEVQEIIEKGIPNLVKAICEGFSSKYQQEHSKNNESEMSNKLKAYLFSERKRK